MKSATDSGTEKRKGASGQGPRYKTNNNPLAKDVSGLKSARAMNNSTSNIKGSMKQDAQTADKVRAGAQDDLERLSQSSFNKKKDTLPTKVIGEPIESTRNKIVPTVN